MDIYGQLSALPKRKTVDRNWLERKRSPKDDKPMSKRALGRLKRKGVLETGSETVAGGQKEGEEEERSE